MKTLKIQEELLNEVKKEVNRTHHQTLSDFVSDAVWLHLQQLVKEKVADLIEQNVVAKDFKSQTSCGMFYTAKHVWVNLNTHGNIHLGISNYWESKCKGVLFVGEFKEGDAVFKGDPFGIVETFAPRCPFEVNELYSPVNGKIVKVNKDVLDNPLILNGNPNQWIVEIKLKNDERDSWMNRLLTLEEYNKLNSKRALGEV